MHYTLSSKHAISRQQAHSKHAARVQQAMAIQSYQLDNKQVPRMHLHLQAHSCTNTNMAVGLSAAQKLNFYKYKLSSQVLLHKTGSQIALKT